MKQFKLVFFILFIGFTSCIQEDIVEDTIPEEIRITSTVNILNEGDIIMLEAFYYNNVGIIENKTINWESSNSTIISIDNASANITALSEGVATITAKTISDDGEELVDNLTITVVASDEVVTPVETIKIGTIVKTSSYVAAGDFEILETSTGIQINLASNYLADQSLPGFALFLTNNPNSLSNALQIDAYDDSDGVHYAGAFTYNVDNVGINDYQYLVQWCRPFSILVGQAIITDK